ncbi:sterol desaturase family protein [Qipengyuania atrilutea]|uniref:Sterol desaturase family protein n=1 Tax=Qipengyuania atrilutea TaxID=2744473 RepID=A0A850H0S5_9SPHN|nr:sterol desaturase family protein [Actirhodobacter atriluteus]NVD43538.1 sterol desaturase family protein [Actirhodobacter atriluteus]
MDNALSDDGILRLSIFATVLLVLGIAEALFPRRQRAMPRRARWVTNTALIAIDTALLRLLLPVLALGMAVLAEQRGWGLFNAIAWPGWAEFLVSLVLLDMAIYWQHVATHRIPFLWRLHKVHHVDRDLDVTSGFRFHPLEIIGSMIWKLALVAALGAPVAAVFVFELLLNAGSMFSHANVRLPLRMDKVLRLVLVTPDMHRIHHSVIRRETDSNFGFSTSLWDRLFGTYREEPEHGHRGMTIGLETFQDERPQSLLQSLLIPFRSNDSDDRVSGSSED